MLKLFAAIMLPQMIARDVIREQKGVSGAKWVSEEKLHITLGFFGEVDPDHAELLDQELATLHAGSFELELKGGGHFGSCLLYTSPSPRDLSTSRMPSSA